MTINDLILYAAHTDFVGIHRRDAGPADCKLVPADLEIPEIRRGNCVSQMRGAAMLWLMELPGSNMFRTIGHTGRCRADFAKHIAPRFLGHLDIFGDKMGWKNQGWTFCVMERQKSSTERASPAGSAQCLIFSCRRSYIPAAVPVPIMSSDVFVQQLFPVFPADTTVKTASAVLAFVPLCAASQTIPDHIRRPTEKAFFSHISDNLRKDI